ncbi:MAG: hypothetical protein ITD31_05775 [Nitrosospira sp.]|nr:hypothetical protein [Nitrosospira sp.]
MDSQRASPLKTLKEIGSNQHEVRSYRATAPNNLKEIGLNKTQSSRWQFSNYLQAAPPPIVRSGYIYSPSSDLYLKMPLYVYVANPIQREPDER